MVAGLDFSADIKKQFSDTVKKLKLLNFLSAFINFSATIKNELMKSIKKQSTIPQNNTTLYPLFCVLFLFENAENLKTKIHRP